MHKIVHDLFEIDLSNVDITLTDENSWFSDSFSTKYSFPFSVDLTDEIKANFADLLDYRSKEIIVEYEVFYIFNDRYEKAILTAEGTFENISFQLKIGIDEFPNFSKKLSEIGLEYKVTTDIYAHAKTIITQSWPAVNYNFPQIHTDKVDTTQPMWTFFEKIINNYKTGDFIINEVVIDEPHNRNLMQPLPYWMHILTQGFLHAGYTLKGDVLEIEQLKKKVLYSETDYHKILDQANINTLVMGTDKIYSSGNEASFLKTIALPQGGRYQINGSINIYGRWKEYARATLKYRGKIIWTAHRYEKKHHSGYLYTNDVDVTFDTVNDGGTHELVFESSQFYDINNVICDLYTTSLFLYNELGVAIPNIVNNNTIDLSRVVPDVTFGNFVTVVKNWYNLDIDLRGKEIWMNFIENQINYENAIDLTEFETPPERTFNKGTSFLLKFSDPRDEVNKHQEMFFNTDGYRSAGFVEDDKTTSIQIQAFPLQNEFRNGVQTGYAIEAESNKIYAVLYDGLNSSELNLTLDPAPMLLPEVAQTFYKNWFDFRLSAINFKWSFTAFTEALNGLTSKRKIFAFGRYHIIKTLPKHQISKDLFDVALETYTLK
jgi:hypothetical protein